MLADYLTVNVVITGRWSEGITPLEFLLAVMRDPKAPPAARTDAAKAAAPYVHPRLSAIELDLGNIDEVTLRKLAE